MKTLPHRSRLLTATALAATVSLLPLTRAQSDKNQSDQSESRRVEQSAVQQHQSDIAATGAQTVTSIRWDEAKDLKDHTAKKLAGHHVRGADAKDLGEVKDFLVDPHAGVVTYAIVSSGGFAGVGDKLRVVPFSALKPSSEKQNEFSIAVDKASWDQLPTIDAKDNKDGRFTITDEQRRQLSSFEHQPNPPTDTTAGAGVNAYLVRASDLTGRQLNSGNLDLGKIEAIIIDPTTAGARALLDPKQDIARANQKFLVPVTALQISGTKHEAITTSLSRREFESANTAMEKGVLNQPTASTNTANAPGDTSQTASTSTTSTNAASTTQNTNQSATAANTTAANNTAIAATSSDTKADQTLSATGRMTAESRQNPAAIGDTTSSSTKNQTASNDETKSAGNTSASANISTSKTSDQSSAKDASTVAQNDSASKAKSSDSSEKSTSAKSSNTADTSVAKSDDQSKSATESKNAASSTDMASTSGSSAKSNTTSSATGEQKELSPTGRTEDKSATVASNDQSSSDKSASSSQSKPSPATTTDMVGADASKDVAANDRSHATTSTRDDQAPQSQASSSAVASNDTTINSAPSGSTNQNQNASSDASKSDTAKSSSALASNSSTDKSKSDQQLTPTGKQSADQIPAGTDPKLVTAAQSIRKSLDDDSALSKAQVTITPEDGKIVLRGTVTDAAQQRTINKKARDGAKGIPVDDQTRLQSDTSK